MPKRTREKQLAKLAARRQAERDAARRRRRLVLGLGVTGLAVILLIVAGSILLAGDEPAATVPASAAASTAPSGIPPSCSDDVPEAAGEPRTSYEQPPPDTLDPAKRYAATIDTSCGVIRIDLLADTAPDAVNSFVFLAREGFYDGLTWHRLVKGFVIQGGDPEGVGTGGPGYELPVTVTKGASFDAKGVVAYAHSAAGGNGSQFFITLAPAPNLDPPEGKYTIFGNVSKGMDVVETIGRFPTGNGESPAQTIYINSITIEARAASSRLHASRAAS